MLKISYTAALAAISFVWCFVRLLCACKSKGVDWKREAQLILVYVCIIVLVRFTFFPFFRVDGMIQPLVFDRAKVFPFRINLIPLVNLLDYEVKKESIINVIGNTAMFIPLGIVWPVVFKRLDTHAKALTAGVLTSLSVEILQLPFHDRVTDIDDLLLNSAGFAVGYLVLFLVRHCGSRGKNKRS